jgi:ribonuclease BN (tRNA processing enzyme)
MKLTVLGNYGPYPPAGGNCSGYLLEHDGCSVLLECGNGVLSNLQYYLEVKDLSAVIISHLHSDHISDLFILRYAWQKEMEKDSSPQPLPVYAPGSPEEEYARIPYKNVFKPETIDEGKDIRIGPMTFSLLQTRHSVPCYAVSVVAEGKKLFVYSADTEYFSGLIAFSAEASLLLCEANYLEEDIEQGAANHMSAFQAGSLALEADVKKLILTHLPPHRDETLYLEEARRAFPKSFLAEQGQNYLCDSGSKDELSLANWVQLGVETDPIILSLIEGRLKTEGIPVMSSGEALGGIYGLTTGPLAERRIFVPLSRLEEAKKVLQEIESHGSESYW